jgi:ubiquinone/menaquinone biosynthesis C-methylase UbiE
LTTYSCDISAANLARARGKIRSDNLKMVRHNITGKLEFDQESFDMLVCCHFLHFIKNPDFALSEFSRVLKNGGVGIIVTFKGPYESFKEGKNRITASLGSDIARQYCYWKIPDIAFNAYNSTGKYYWTLDEFKGRLGLAGFNIIKITDTFMGCSMKAIVLKKN